MSNEEREELSQVSLAEVREAALRSRSQQRCGQAELVLGMTVVVIGALLACIVLVWAFTEVLT